MRADIASAVLVLLASCAPPPGIPRRPRAYAAATSEQAPPPDCVHSWREARQRGSAYDHVVHLSSGCHTTSICQVSTDVAPTVVVVAVEPGEHVEVVTMRSSPLSAFTPAVKCSRPAR